MPTIPTETAPPTRHLRGARAAGRWVLHGRHAPSDDGPPATRGQRSSLPASTLLAIDGAPTAGITIHAALQDRPGRIGATADAG